MRYSLLVFVLALFFFVSPPAHSQNTPVELPDYKGWPVYLTFGDGPETKAIYYRDIDDNLLWDNLVIIYGGHDVYSIPNVLWFQVTKRDSRGVVIRGISRSYQIGITNVYQLVEEKEVDFSKLRE